MALTHDVGLAQKILFRGAGRRPVWPAPGLAGARSGRRPVWPAPGLAGARSGWRLVWPELLKMRGLGPLVFVFAVCRVSKASAVGTG